MRKPLSDVDRRAYCWGSGPLKGAEMGILDDAKETAETTGRKMKDAFDDAADKAGDKADEVKADSDVKKAEAERDSVKARNEAKEKLRGEE